MGSSFFSKGKAPKVSSGGGVHPTGMNMMARALGAPAYGGAHAAGLAAKDLGAASAFGKAPPKITSKSASTAPKGPKV